MKKNLPVLFRGSLVAALLTVSQAEGHSVGDDHHHHHDETDHHHATHSHSAPSLWDALPEWISPSLHLRSLWQDGLEEGHSAGLANDGLSMQLIEPGLLLEKNRYRFQAIGHIVGSNEGWDGELEELWASAPLLPWGGELRIGQFLTPWGRQNQQHLHDRNFVEQNLVESRLLAGEEGLLMRGARLNWHTKNSATHDTLSIGLGQSMAHSHAHADHLETPAEALWDGWLASTRVSRRWDINAEASHTLGLNALAGEQEGDDWGQLIGLDWGWQRELSTIQRISFQFEAGAQRFNARKHSHEGEEEGHEHEHEHEHEEEHADAHEHHEHEGHDHEHGHEAEPDQGKWSWETGLSAIARADINDSWSLALRSEWVSAVTSAERPERWRISPALTWRPSAASPLMLRGQYSYEFGSGFDEHLLMFQVGLSWGEH